MIVTRRRITIPNLVDQAWALQCSDILEGNEEKAFIAATRHYLYEIKFHEVEALPRAMLMMMSLLRTNHKEWTQCY